MMPRVALSLLVIAAMLACPRLGDAESLAAKWPIPETPQQRDMRLKWWRDDGFGMVIHWGLYAITAGEWKGKQIDGAGEWIMNHGRIPLAEYKQLAPQFNPQNYDPAEWVRIAKDAGMKYVMMTSKHHDGFCLWDTKTTDWDVVDATPYGKDILTPLAEECRKQGLKFCLYYSIMDWHHPSQLPGGDSGAYNPTKIIPERKQEYVDYMKAQLKELIETLQPGTLWFDGDWPTWWTDEDGKDLYVFVRTLKPDLITNNRLTSRRETEPVLGMANQIGDFGSPEQDVPATGLPGVDWEACMTMNGTWGFQEYDEDWKSAEVLIHHLIDIASKGGNYLLNVGPTADGEIPQASVERLAEMGRWMRANSESIYSTTASVFPALPWGRCTVKRGEGRTTLYLHVFDWPKDGRLRVPGLRNDVHAARLLSDGQELTASREGDDVAITVPRAAPDPIATVIALEIDGDPDVAAP